MTKSLLNITDLYASAEDKTILQNLNLNINKGETHILMGPNGAGKSTLGNVIMGNSQYKVDRGSIFFKDEDITSTRTDERAQKGLFLSFQSPIEIPGVSISQFIRTAMETKEKIRLKAFRDKLKTVTKTLGINEQWINRELNVGFSGGERKKIEMLQLLMLNPKLAILDETDSGLDVDAMRVVADGVNKMHTSDNSAIVITHYERLLDMIKPSVVHVLYNGRIVKTAGPELAKEIEARGYDWIKEEADAKFGQD